MPMRAILAVVAGVIVGGLIIAGIEFLSTMIFLASEGVNPMDQSDMRELMHRIPVGALVVVVLAYFVGVTAGAWTAIRLHPTHARWAGYVVVALFAMATVANMLSLPHPPWMYVASPVALVAGLILALRLAPAERLEVADGGQ